MNFWDLIEQHGEKTAILLGSDVATFRSLSYKQLAVQSDAFGGCLPNIGRKRLGLLLCSNTVQAIVAYLGALRAGDSIILLNELTDLSLLSKILDSYKPDWICRSKASDVIDYYVSSSCTENLQLLIRSSFESDQSLHPDLCVLLSTSGTTGSPKMVRLSKNNINSNAQAIVEYLSIDSTTRTISTLPFNYSFGMSVLNSHFFAGGSILVTEYSLMAREFWDSFELHQINSLPGVPYIFQILQRLNPDKLPLKSLRTLTQAGGALSSKLIDFYENLSHKNKWQFFVMYGQTEASPRISYVPPSMLKYKKNSIGIAIPGGKLTIGDEDELIFEGPNVMLGYAENRSQLALGDLVQGRLYTGDLARRDEDGFFYIIGRRKRFIKIHGNRINLDDIEQNLETILASSVVVLGEDDKLKIFIEHDYHLEICRSELIRTYRLHPSTFEFNIIQAIPFTSSGKKDYAKLKI
jgi:acyl-CoA synthetase (AMP-forming)/AMP-acid ligase II